MIQSSNNKRDLPSLSDFLRFTEWVGYDRQTMDELSLLFHSVGDVKGEFMLIDAEEEMVPDLLEEISSCFGDDIIKSDHRTICRLLIVTNPSVSCRLVLQEFAVPFNRFLYWLESQNNGEVDDK